MGMFIDATGDDRGAIATFDSSQKVIDTGELPG